MTYTPPYAPPVTGCGRLGCLEPEQARAIRKANADLTAEVARLRVDDPWCQPKCDEAADRIAALEALVECLQGEDACIAAFAAGQRSLPTGTFVLQDSPELETLRAERDRLRKDAYAMRDLMREASGDLAAYINSEYPPETCDSYPSVRSKRERDYDIVRRITAEIARQDMAALGDGQ